MLKNKTMNKDIIINILKKYKPLLEQKFSISKIGLFGSYAKNNNNQNSDIDIIYHLAEGKYLGLKENFELENFFHSIFKEKKIDLVNKKYINPIIEEEINKNIIYV